MNKKIYIIIALSVLALLVAFILAAGINGDKNIVSVTKPTPTPTATLTPIPTLTPTPTSAAIKCLPEQRNAEVCTADFNPVCATVQIQCIKAPCNPIQETFSNSCDACKNPLVDSYIAGECK
ncbi:MAG: hypothetical protein Q7S12_04560 [bacterium]|nr:hypothetical protein [bacterium]